MTTPHIEHADLSDLTPSEIIGYATLGDLIQRCSEARYALDLVVGTATLRGPPDGPLAPLERLADAASAGIGDVLAELRRIAAETTP